MDIQGYYDEYQALSKLIFKSLIHVPLCIISCLLTIGIFYLRPNYNIIYLVLLDVLYIMYIYKYQFFRAFEFKIVSRMGCLCCAGLAYGFPVTKEYVDKYDPLFALFVRRNDNNDDIYAFNHNQFYASYLKWQLKTERIPPSALVPTLIRSKEEYELFKRYITDWNIDYHSETDYDDIWGRGYIRRELLDQKGIPYENVSIASYIKFPKVDDARQILDKLYDE